MLRVFVLILFLFLISPFTTLAANEIGVIKTTEGEVNLVRNGETLVGSVGTRLVENDVLKTGSDGSVGAIMRDDTTLSLGPGSELVMNEYIFEPKDDSFSVVLRIIRGTFIYMSGVIGKLAPESIRIETPDSTIAVRGTRLLIKVDD
jgi:hypothetical protein